MGEFNLKLKNVFLCEYHHNNNPYGRSYPPPAHQNGHHFKLQTTLNPNNTIAITITIT